MVESEFYVDEQEKKNKQPVRRRVNLKQAEGRVIVMIDDIKIFEIHNSGRIERWTFCNHAGVEIEPDNYSRPKIYDR